MSGARRNPGSAAQRTDFMLHLNELHYAYVERPQPRVQDVSRRVMAAPRERPINYFTSRSVNG